jgi:hypothetical protein
MIHFIILNTFFENSDTVKHIPDSLVLRNQSIMWLTLSALSCSFLLLAFSNIGTNRLVGVFSKMIFKNSSILKIINEEYSIKNFSSFLLILNFVITSCFLIYLSLLHYQPTTLENYLIFIPLFPLYVLMWPLLTYYFVGFISNQHKVFLENRKNIVLICQFLGLLFSFLLLFWTFNIKWAEMFSFLFIGILGLLWFFKILRGIIFSFMHGVAWYYIILYFCTLEILPLILIFSIFIG